MKYSFKLRPIFFLDPKQRRASISYVRADVAPSQARELAAEPAYQGAEVYFAAWHAVRRRSFRESQVPELLRNFVSQVQGGGFGLLLRLTGGDPPYALVSRGNSLLH